MAERGRQQGLAAQAQSGVQPDLLAVLCNIIDSHESNAWKERAKAQIVDFARGAQDGKSVKQVPFSCKGCATNGVAHHIFCRGHKKPREKDEAVVRKLKAKLNMAAVEACPTQVPRATCPSV
jgi:hypothetical protein